MYTCVVAQQVGEKRKVRACKDCGKIFDSKPELKAHRKAEHKRTPEDTTTTLLTQSGETLHILDWKKPDTEPVNFTNDSSDDINGLVLTSGSALAT